MEVIGKLSDIDRCFCVSYRNEVMDVDMWRQEIARWEGGGRGRSGVEFVLQLGSFRNGEAVVLDSAVWWETRPESAIINCGRNYGCVLWPFAGSCIAVITSSLMFLATSYVVHKIKSSPPPPCKI